VSLIVLKVANTETITCEYNGLINETKVGHTHTTKLSKDCIRKVKKER